MPAAIDCLPCERSQLLRPSVENRQIKNQTTDTLSQVRSHEAASGCDYLLGFGKRRTEFSRCFSLASLASSAEIPKRGGHCIKNTEYALSPASVIV